ncbi:unnamed protein product [Peronospora farinosa]|uniref:Secreted protein n=1 Tax=Peronospora farinosa TaxID=134698 RepID=A0ABN8CGC0_9STRA|nr:unnamed protein product [Peronospora farinosa]
MRSAALSAVTLFCSLFFCRCCPGRSLPANPRRSGYRFRHHQNCGSPCQCLPATHRKDAVSGSARRGLERSLSAFNR